jgi:uncharacterized protein YrzB (UPF0473 family)
MSDRRTITCINHNHPPQTEILNILVEFRSSVTNKRYILFTLETQPLTNTSEVQACIIDRTNYPVTLNPIETEFEWEMIQAVFDEYIKPTKESEDVP